MRRLVVMSLCSSLLVSYLPGCPDPDPDPDPVDQGPWEYLGTETNGLDACREAADGTVWATGSIYLETDTYGGRPTVLELRGGEAAGSWRLDAGSPLTVWAIEPHTLGPILIGSSMPADGSAAFAGRVDTSGDGSFAWKTELGGGWLNQYNDFWDAVAIADTVHLFGCGSRQNSEEVAFRTVASAENGGGDHDIEGPLRITPRSCWSAAAYDGPGALYAIGYEMDFVSPDWVGGSLATQILEPEIPTIRTAENGVGFMDVAVRGDTIVAFGSVLDPDGDSHVTVFWLSPTDLSIIRQVDLGIRDGLGDVGGDLAADGSLILFLNEWLEVDDNAQILRLEADGTERWRRSWPGRWLQEASFTADGEHLLLCGDAEPAEALGFDRMWVERITDSAS
jgi:hypothetical protein